MAKIKLCILLLLAVSLTVTACDSNRATVEGYYLNSHVASGGKRIDKANLRGIEVSETDDDTASVAITFVEGSRLAGDDENPLSHLPPYSVSMLTSPARIKVEFQNVLYWDFVPYANPGAKLVSGIFQAARTSSTEAVIYIQLIDDVIYNIEEIDNQLIIKLKSSDEGVPENVLESSFYVVLDAWSGGTELPKDFSLTPTLCGDYYTPVLISSPYSHAQEADQQAMKLNDYLKTAIPGKEATVETLPRNGVPSYKSDIGDISAIMLPDNDSFTASLLAADARFVAYTDDGIIAAKQNRQDAEGSESLWLIQDAQQTPVTNAQFSMVGNAALSPDGKYLAFIEEAESSSPLYVLNLGDGELSFLGEEFGMYTTSFTWSPEGMLYVLAGDEEMSIGIYDPIDMTRGDLTGGPKDESIYDSDLAVIDGNVFFAEDSQAIYSLNTDDGQRRKVGEGSRFSASSDNKRLAVAAYGDSIDEDAYSVLKTIMLSNGQEQIIENNRLIADCVWSNDSSRIYYLLYADNSGGGGDMPYELHVYEVSSGAKTKLGSLAAASVYQGRTPDELIYSCGVEQSGGYTFNTYSLIVK